MCVYRDKCPYYHQDCELESKHQDCHMKIIMRERKRLIG